MSVLSLSLSLSLLLPHNVYLTTFLPLMIHSSLMTCVSLFRTDSPGVPVSATSKELFRGFSYVDPSLMDYAPSTAQPTTVHMSTVNETILQYVHNSYCTVWLIILTQLCSCTHSLVTNVVPLPMLVIGSQCVIGIQICTREVYGVPSVGGAYCN